jgi:hypothetical protein
MSTILLLLKPTGSIPDFDRGVSQVSITSISHDEFVCHDGRGIEVALSVELKSR